MATDAVEQANAILEYIGINRESNDQMVDDTLAHEGKPRRSGRYPFGSGERPYQGVSKGLARKLKKKAKRGKLNDDEPRPKTIAEMTDKEIQARIERLKLEKALQELMPKEPAAPNPNQELKDRVERLKLERDLRDLTTVKPNQDWKERAERIKLEKEIEDARAPKRAFIKKVGAGILEKSLDNIGTQGLTYFLGTAINKAANKRDEKGNLIEIVNPKKGQKDK